MIKACSYFPGGSEPERALDLWTEMTIEKEIEPTTEAYTAVIFACARSGQKDYIAEAFRIAKQMLDAHRDAYGRSPFHPTSTLVRALLEGAKRIGDVGRARWILAELTSQSGDHEIVIDGAIMTNVFHAYGAYRPPLRRSYIPLVQTPQELAESLTSSEESNSTKVAAAPVQGTPLSVPPQTPEQTVAEARYLFNIILEDVKSGTGPFAKITFHPALIDAYLSVYWTHASFSDGRKVFESVWSQANVSPSAQPYVGALERCTRALKGPERTEALQWAQELWKEWAAFEDRGIDHSIWRNSQRLIERAYAAMIRVLAL
jgi:hypothetical protein